MDFDVKGRDSQCHKKLLFVSTRTSFHGAQVPFAPIELFLGFSSRNSTDNMERSLMRNPMAKYLRDLDFGGLLVDGWARCTVTHVAVLSLSCLLQTVRSRPVCI